MSHAIVPSCKCDVISMLRHVYRAGAPSRVEEKGRIEVAKKEDPPNSLQREEVINNDLGRRSPWWLSGVEEGRSL